MSKLGEVFVEVLGDADPLAASVGEAFDSMEKEAAGFGSRFESALTGPIAKGAAGAGAAAAGAIAVGLNQAVSLDAQLREVQTLFGRTGDVAAESIKDLQGPVRDLSTEVGIAQSQIVDGLYNAISAGVPEENAFEFLEVASKFAIGGVTDVETAVDGLTTAINAFGLDAADADQVADSFFAAIQGGKTNAEELSASLFQVAPAASAAGIGLDETLAGVAALTASGTPTSVATTQMRAAINELADSGSNVGGIFEDLAGVAFRDFIAQGGTLEEALGIVGDAALESGDVIGDYFGSVEAGAAAATLYNDSAGAFAANLELQADAAGKAGDAYQVVAEGSAQQLEVLKAQGAALLTSLGQVFLPVFNQILGVITGVFGAFTNLPEPVQKFLSVIIGLVAVLGPLPLILGKLIPLFKAGGAFAVGLKAITTGFRALGAAIMANPLFLIIAAVIAVVAILWYFRDEIMAAIGAAWDWLKRATTAVWDWLKNLWSGLPGMIGDAWNTVIGWFKDLPGRLIDALGGLASTVFEFIKKWHPLAIMWRLMTGGGDESGDGVIGWLTGLPGRIVESLGGLASTVWEFIKTYHPLAILWRFITGREPSEGGGDGVFSALREIPGRIIGALGELAGSVWEFIKTYNPVAVLWRFITGREPGEGSEQSIGEFFTALPGKIIDWLMELPGMVFDFIMEWNPIAILMRVIDHFAPELGEQIRQFVTDIVDWFAELPTRIKELWEMWWWDLRDATYHQRKALVELIQGLRDRVVEFFTGMVDTVRTTVAGWVTGLIETVTGLRDRFTSRISEMIDGAVQWFKDLPGRILDAVKDFGSLLVQVGKDLINGLTRGIKDVAMAPVNAVRDVGSNIVSGAKSLFGISSPSRLMADEVGGPIMDGVTRGIHDHASSALAELQQFANDASEAGRIGGIMAQPSVMPGVAAGSGMIRPDEIGQGSGPAGGVSWHVEQTVMTADPREAADESVRRLRELAVMGAPFAPPPGGDRA